MLLPMLRVRGMACLQNDGYFNRVELLPDGSGIEWPEGQDVAPHELYENSIAINKTA